eukprot:2288094-Alexandrium_andersonii.AAC.1
MPKAIFSLLEQPLRLLASANDGRPDEDQQGWQGLRVWESCSVLGLGYPNSNFGCITVGIAKGTTDTAVSWRGFRIIRGIEELS